MRKINFIPTAAWVLAAISVGTTAFLGWRTYLAPPPGSAALDGQAAAPEPLDSGPKQDRQLALPTLQPRSEPPAVSRRAVLHTIIPSRPRQDVRTYQVAAGDSVFGIARKFSVQPETVLWANYDLLNDNPDRLTPGMALNIPPVDGVYYQWQEGDTLEAVAARFEVSPEAILEFAGNHLDLVHPQIPSGAWVMVPGGRREFRQWVVPTIPRGAAGVSRSVYGPGACDGGYEGAFGSGGFIYPTANHSLSGNDYWSGHLGIDLAAGTGASVVAADAGVVVFSGWATGGYGYMVMIDHGNGYQTVYAHLSSVRANCGQSVGQGTLIGAAGSTGNSTGSHLHFEVRYLGGFVSPWFVLPAP